MKLNSAKQLERGGGRGTVTSDLNLEFFIAKMRLILCTISTYPEHGRFKIYNDYAIVLNIKSREFLFYSFQYTLVNLSVFINVFFYIHFIKIHYTMQYTTLHKHVDRNYKARPVYTTLMYRPSTLLRDLCMDMHMSEVVCIKFHYIVHFSSKPTRLSSPPFDPSLYSLLW